MTWNIEGLRGAISSSPERNPLLNNDIVCLQETFLSEITDETRYFLPEYNWEISPASTIGGKMRQGIAIVAKQHFKMNLLNCSSTHLAVSIGMLNVISFYFPPLLEIANIVYDISNVLSQTPHVRPTILCGDFNCRTDRGKRGQELISELQRFGFTVCNNLTTPTYISPSGNSSIDLVFSNLAYPERVNSISVCPTLERKHQRVICELTLFNVPNKKLSPPKPLSRKIDMESLLQSLICIPPPKQNDIIQQLTTTVTDLITSSIPQRKDLNHHHKAWFDRKCGTLKKRTLELKKTAFITGDYNTFKKSQREYKNLISERKGKHDEEELLKKIEDSEKAPWLRVRVQRSQLPSPIDLDRWQEHFSNLYDPENQPPNIPELSALVLPEERIDEAQWYNAEFSEEEVFYSIHKSSMKKAPGPDRICYEHLKHSLPFLLPIFHKLFNLCLTRMEIPNTWRTSLLKTLFKNKGERDNPNNYRGIALLNSLFKTLTSLINKRIRTVFHLLPPDQFGFQPGKDTRQPIATLIHSIKRSLEKKNGKIYVLFVDFFKAFDSVERPRLMNKLRNDFGIKGKILGLIGSIMRSNFIQVSDGTLVSDPIRQSKGVQQGDSLSPTLFILYITDLSSQLNNEAEVEKQFYADDLEAHSETPTEIQNTLNCLEKWCLDNGLHLNESKTKVVKFRKGGRLAQNDVFTYHDKEIEVVSSYEYLGITLQSQLTFTEHILKIKRKSAAVIGTLTKLHLVTVDCAIRIFNMKIKPIITYCLDIFAEFLTKSQLLELDKTKSMFIKKALCVHFSTSSTLVHELVGSPFLCEELHHNSVVSFNQTAWNSYKNHRLERRNSFKLKYGTSGPAFTTQDWKKNNYQHRHYYTRTTSHGFHHLLCSSSTSCFEIKDTCRCILCNSYTSLYHINECCFKKDSLPKTVMFLTNLRGKG